MEEEEALSATATNNQSTKDKEVQAITTNKSSTTISFGHGNLYGCC